MLDCPGCVRRREAMRDFGRRMADWVKRPQAPPPDVMPTHTLTPTVDQADALDRIRKLMSSNKS